MPKTNIQLNVANPVTTDDALTWCLNAWMETKTRGYYVASGFKGVRSKDVFNVAALRAGLCEKTPVNKIIRCVWKNLHTAPDATAAKQLFSAYKKYQKETTEKAKRKAAVLKAAKKKAAQKATSTTADKIIKAVDKVKDKPTFNDGGMWHKGYHIEDRLTRIEGKINRLLNIWDK